MPSAISSRWPGLTSRNFKKDGVYAKLLAEVTERQEKLIETLSPEQKALFDEASKAEIDLSVENDHDLFIKASSSACRWCSKS